MLTILENEGMLPLPAGVEYTNGWYPVNEPQYTLLNCRAQMALFGGQSGGGKSNVLVADSAQEYENPHFRGMLIRRSFREMNNIKDEMKKIYRPLGGRSSEGGQLWRFPSGAEMRLGYMSADKDIENFTGNPISWLGIDEAQFQTEKRIRAIISWCATPPEYGLRDRIRITANPSTPWLKKLFLKNECPICHPERSVIPCAIYEGATWTDDDLAMLTTAFIPAKLADNPLYGAQKKAALMSQTADVRKKLLDGCWCHTEGAFLPFLNESYIFPYSDCNEQWWHNHFLSMDYGFSNSAASTGLYFINESGIIFKVMEDIQRKMYSEEYAHHIANKMVLRQIGQQNRRVQITSGYADSAMDAHTGNTGRSNLQIINDILNKFDVHLIGGAKAPQASAQLLAGKLKRREFVITDACPKTYECWSSRKSDPDRPGCVKKEPGDELDDVCLVAGTMVKTVHGDRSIETIKPGNLVLTRRGARRVTWSGMTSENALTMTAEFSDGRTISGTPNHPVFVVGKGFIGIDSLQYGDNIEICSESALSKKSLIGELLSAVTPSVRSGARGITSCRAVATEHAELKIFTGKSTRTILALSRKAILFITRMRMLLTMLPATMSCSPGLIMPSTIPTSACWIPFISLEPRQTRMRSVTSQRNGIDPQPAASGTANMPRSSGPMQSKSHLFASNAAWPFSVLPSIGCFVLRRAQRSGVVGLDLMTSKDPASAAPQVLPSTDSKVRDSALVSVLRVTIGKRESVYNLSVEGEQEYFANGVLVHNCDTDLYGLNNYCQGNQKPEEVKTAERIAELKGQGVNDMSLNVIRWRMEKEAAKQAAPATIGRMTIGSAGRIIRR